MHFLHSSLSRSTRTYQAFWRSTRTLKQSCTLQ
ncbi:unnamed protein product [Timema podura]|uniref:Uncharacterized protein n=1 Tax=Timema podura TaxID=61482 RepID=A0ABN7P692_TIMPD|nr:unnamed protein product [Timema podura]